MSPAASDPGPQARGFAPLVASGARVLLLGSLPSRLSIETGQYYGNPRNSFWRIMGDLFGAGPELAYAERVARLTDSGVAVWDVLQSSVRPGSLDASIRIESAVANDFQRFFAEHAGIETVCFNGQKAAQLYARLVAGRGIGSIGRRSCPTLPSTSPAHAALSYEEKLRQWSVVRSFTGPNRRP